MAGLYVQPELRPCYVQTYIYDLDRPWKIVKGDVQNALFHCWVQFSEVLSPSPMAGGHHGGVISGVRGIVEFANGTIKKVNPEDITFIDNKHEEYYCFVEKED